MRDHSYDLQVSMAAEGRTSMLRDLIDDLSKYKRTEAGFMEERPMDDTVERIVYDGATSEDEDKENVNWSNLARSRGPKEAQEMRGGKNDAFKGIGEVRGGFAQYLQDLIDKKKKQKKSICQICIEEESSGACIECNYIEYCESCFKNIHQKGILSCHQL